MPAPIDRSSQQVGTPSNQIAFQNKQFVSDYQPTSANLFSFYAQDGRYNLRCSMTLALQEVLASEFSEDMHDQHLIPVLAGDFPSIGIESVLEKSFGNEYIQAILTTRFYLQILESLFYFTEKVKANGLTLTFTDRNLDIAEAFQRFIIAENRIHSEKGHQTKIMILTDSLTYNNLMDTIDSINTNYRQTLWRKQWGNPMIREYLKSYALTEF
jgi:hypothetical protein